MPDAAGPQQPMRRRMVDPAVQMDAVGKMAFEKCRLLNKGEFAVFRVLEETLSPLSGYRLMAQTSLGEVIRPVRSAGSEIERAEAHAAINSKRLDFAVIDRSGHLALAIEFQGAGHHQGQAFLRDAVKREALRRAGVEMLEVGARWDAEILHAQVLHALGVSRVAQGAAREGSSAGCAQPPGPSGEDGAGTVGPDIAH
ncbi:MAG: DUF2726 domain-containing protein [Pseudomonadota bacterium]